MLLRVRSKSRCWLALGALMALSIYVALLYSSVASPSVEVAAAPAFVNPASPTAVVQPMRPTDNEDKTASAGEDEGRLPEMVLSVVACGDRLNDTLVVLKSAVAMTRGRRLQLIVVADDALRPEFMTEYSSWPPDIRRRVQISVHPLDFPKDGSADEWRNLFKLCASQRLFLPSLLRDVDATLYVDTDVIFLRPLDDIWRFFDEMNSSQVAAMAPENEDFATGWYNRFAQHPFYKPLGVNSGVMLMNLTRIRQFDWEVELVDLYKKYKQKITWGDQDLLNIYFHRHPEKLLVYPCEWNYRTDHCMYASVCHSAEKHGVAVAHGSRNVFHGTKQPTFRVLFETVQKYELGEDLRTHLLEPLRRNLQHTIHTNCGKMYRIFLKALEKYV